MPSLFLSTTSFNYFFLINQFEPSIGNLSSEKARQLSIIETNAKKIPKLDITKATNKALRQEEEQA